MPKGLSTAPGLAKLRARIQRRSACVDRKRLDGLAEFLQEAWLQKVGPCKSGFELEFRTVGGTGVELVLNKDAVVAVCYDTHFLDVPPSEFRESFEGELTDRLPVLPVTVQANLDSRSATTRALESPIISPIGSSGRIPTAEKWFHSLVLHFQQRSEEGWGLRCTIVAQFENCELRKQGLAVQLRALIAGAAAEELNFEPGGAAAHIIVAAPEPPRNQRVYVPPMRSAFPNELDDLPTELAPPLRDLFEGAVESDWDRVASAWPDPDVSAAGRAARHQEDAEFDGFYRFADSVVDWWIEGDLAFVAFHGLQHYGPDGDDSPEDVPAIFEFSLRRVNGDWYIRDVAIGTPQDVD